MQVRLIGYCVEGPLFLVYEYIENGNLSQHLRGSGENCNASTYLSEHLILSMFVHGCILYFGFQGGIHCHGKLE